MPKDARRCSISTHGRSTPASSCVAGAPLRSRLRHYTNLSRMAGKLSDLLGDRLGPDGCAGRAREAAEPGLGGMNAPLRHADTVRQVDFDDPRDIARVEAFVEELDGGVFHRPLWLQAIVRGTETMRSVSCSNAGRACGWLPLTGVHSPLFGRALVSSGFGVGGGVLAGDARDGERLCHAAEELAQRHSIPDIELRGGCAPPDWTVVTGKHANFAGPLTEDDEAQLLAIPRKARAEVRKGLKNDLATTVGQTERDRMAHYAVYAESVRNLGTPVFPRGLFDAMLDLFGEAADILTVWEGDTPVSSVLSLYPRARSCRSGAAAPGVHERCVPMNECITNSWVTRVAKDARGSTSVARRPVAAVRFQEELGLRARTADLLHLVCRSGPGTQHRSDRR